jgi:hypothetical protein
MEWQFRYRIENVKEYVQVVAKLKMPVDVLYEIPLAESPNANNKYPALISPKKWEEMLLTCLRTDDAQEQIAIARAARKLLLKDLGMAGFDLTDPRNIELQDIVNEAPDFIRDSDLELNEKAYIADAYVEGIGEETVLEAKRLATKRLTDRKRILESGSPQELEQLRPIFKLSLDQIMRQALQQTVADHERKQQEENGRQQQQDALGLLSSPQQLATAIADKLAPTSLKKFLINKRPAVEILVARVSALPEPERQLIAAHLIGHKELALKVWFQSMRRDCEVENVAIKNS